MSKFIKLSKSLTINLDNVIAIRLKYDTSSDGVKHSYRYVVYTANVELKFKFYDGSDEFYILSQHVNI